MAVIKEYKSGGTTIKICDDYLPKTEGEKNLRFSMLDNVMLRLIESQIGRGIIDIERRNEESENSE